MTKRQPKFAHSGELGGRLREERQKTGLSQTDFAALVGSSLQSQMRYETGQALPKLDYLFALLDHEIDAGYVVTGRRSDGVIHPLEQSFLNDFRRLSDADKEDIIIITAALLETQGREKSPEARAAARVNAALADYQMPRADNLVADLRKSAQLQGQTLHSPKLAFKPKPADD
ncbi:helix-turn-helix transcriptional regulator [Nostoc sp. CHAB 5834]|nr:helix-turn-helix transcriptional regulator [Nostoc sp. CHAB 5834]